MQGVNRVKVPEDCSAGVQGFQSSLRITLQWHGYNVGMVDSHMLYTVRRETPHFPKDCSHKLYMHGCNIYLRICNVQLGLQTLK